MLMDRTVILWSIVLFVGGTLLFRAIAEATEDRGTGVSLGLQALALAAVVGGIVFVVRRRG